MHLVGVNKFFLGDYMATLFNDILYAIRGRCICDESASVAAAEVAELVAKKLTSTNKQSTPLCENCQRKADNSCKVETKCVYFIPIE